jgi:hypothetical protein
VATDSEPVVWKAPPLTWARFDDSRDWIVFNPSSSQVHLINEPAHRLWILATDGRPHSVGALAGALAAPGEPVTEAALDLTRDTLAFMDDEGLLTPA